MSLYSLIKAAAFQFLPPPVLFNIKKWHYCNKLKEATIHTEQDLFSLNFLVKEGDIALDIGANFGLYTKFLSLRTGKTGHVFSFEPVPETFKYLENNIRQLHLGNVTATNYAVSDRAGETAMTLPSYASGGGNFYEARIGGSTESVKGKTVRVQTIVLDDFLPGKAQKISFIKCDTEGHEWFCFKGAEKIIMGDKPAIMVEIKGDFTEAGANGFKLVSFLKAAGYEMFYFDGAQFIACNKPGVANNFFFLTKQQREAL